MGCQKKWSYNYQEGLVPRVERPFLTIGKLCHAGFQDGMMSYADNGDIDVALAVGVDPLTGRDVYMDSFCFLEEELPEFENTVADAIRVFNHAWYDFEPWRYEVLKVVNSEGKVIPALELHFGSVCWLQRHAGVILTPSCVKRILVSHGVPITSFVNHLRTPLRRPSASKTPSIITPV